MPPPATFPVAVLDANVLYPQFLRDVMLRLAAAGLFVPRWTDRIHEEWTRNLAVNRPDIPTDRIAHLRMLMEKAFPDAQVAGYEADEMLFSSIDAKDRRVAAAALKCGAGVIVTWNLRGFPAEGLREHGLRASDPDAFIAALIGRDRVTASSVVEAHRVGLSRPPHSKAEYRAALESAGLTRSARKLFG